MALIICPECKNHISDKSTCCPHCGLPAKYFLKNKAVQEASVDQSLDYSNLGNILLSFDQDYSRFFGKDYYTAADCKV